MGTHRIRILTPAEAKAGLDGLVDLLFDAVESGAGVNFVWPMTREKAERWWRGALDSHARGERAILVADVGGRFDGTVQLVPAPQENQPFRADVAKLLVHRRARRQGVGEALMRGVEDEARRMGRTLLTLDTESGGAADRLYARLGWIRAGEIPGYALIADGGRRQAATFFYREL